MTTANPLDTQLPLQIPLLLASASPRRRQIIASLGLPYTVATTATDEEALQDHYHGSPAGTAQYLATQKALAMLALPEAQGRIVVTADTTVLLDEQILNKPRDEAHAYELLSSLRGRWHRVVTGVVVSSLDADGLLTLRAASHTTPVLMRPYTDEEISVYIASGDPMDKAGAYGIQSALFQPTERIDGCYLNVVGLPLCLLVELLATFNIFPKNTTCQDCPCPWSEQCRK